MSERRYNPQSLELRTVPGGKQVIAGYAIVFNQLSGNLGGFVEVIEPRATNSVDFSDTVATFNHNSNIVLGRVPKTMSYRVDSKGVYVEIQPPETRKDILEHIRRGDIKGMSFTFRIKKGGDTWEAPNAGRILPLRRITAFDIIPELGPVTNPAYTQTDVTVAMRSLELFKKKNPKAFELAEYHRKLRLKIQASFLKKI